MLRMGHSAGLQYFENCLRRVLDCLSFSCKEIKIQGKFRKCHANKPVINHWTCGNELLLTAIPIFQGENARCDALLLIWKSSDQSWKIPPNPNKRISFGSIPCNCCVSWILSWVDIASSQMKSHFVFWKVQVCPFFSHWDFCPLIDRNGEENRCIALLTAANVLSPESCLRASF